MLLACVCRELGPDSTRIWDPQLLEAPQPICIIRLKFLVQSQDKLKKYRILIPMEECSILSTLHVIHFIFNNSQLMSQILLSSTHRELKLLPSRFILSSAYPLQQRNFVQSTIRIQIMMKPVFRVFFTCVVAAIALVSASDATLASSRNEDIPSSIALNGTSHLTSM